MSDENNNQGSGANRSSKEPGIHHVNIKAKERAIARLRRSFRKVEMPIEIERTKETITALLILMEVQPTSCYLFTKKRVRKDDYVVLNFYQPLAIEIRGRIRYSEQVNQGTAVQVEKGEKTYRTLVEFQLPNDLARNAMKDFYNQVRDESYVATQWHMYISDKLEKARKNKEIIERVKKEENEHSGAKSSNKESRLDEKTIANMATEEATGRISRPPNDPSVTDQVSNDPSATDQVSNDRSANEDDAGNESQKKNESTDGDGEAA